MATISFGTCRGSGFGGNDILQSLTMPISVDGQILSFNSTLDGGAGDDTISGNSTGDYMIGRTGNDYVSGNGMDSLFQADLYHDAFPDAACLFFAPRCTGLGQFSLQHDAPVRF